MTLMLQHPSPDCQFAHPFYMGKQVVTIRDLPTLQSLSLLKALFSWCSFSKESYKSDCCCSRMMLTCDVWLVCVHMGDQDLLWFRVAEGEELLFGESQRVMPGLVDTIMCGCGGNIYAVAVTTKRIIIQNDKRSLATPLPHPLCT